MSAKQDANTKLSTLDDWRRATVAAMRRNPKVDRAVRAECLALYAEGLQDYSHDELRDELLSRYKGEGTWYSGTKKASCVATFDELASLHCIDSEVEFGENGAGLVETLTHCGVSL